MRTCLALLCFLVLFASPFFFAYLEAERLLGCPDCIYRWFDTWLPIVVILATVFFPITLPCMFDWLGEDVSE